MARERSPNYPASDLGKAIQDAATLYAREGRTATALEVTAKAWKYKSLSGPARSRIGALRQYGLVTQSKGKLNLTDLALTLILRQEDTDERRLALRRAALAPAIFSELYDTHRSASGDALRHHLIVDRRFTEDGAKRLIESFRETLAFAKLEEASYDRTNDDGAVDGEPNLEPFGNQTYRLPISPTRSIVMHGAFPITPLEWDQMLAVLEAMRAALVVKSP